MIDFTLLSVFIPTFAVVSATPGMCMTLSLTLGMSIGVRRTLWMMLGELIGVALVAILAVLGVAQLMLDHPFLFSLLKYFGGAYLVYLGIEQWRKKQTLSLPHSMEQKRLSSPLQLFNQGLITAIANPKGWAFMISLLPPFINPNLTLLPQLSLLVTIILMTEFSFLLIYANGGKKLKNLLQKNHQIHRLYQLSGSLMMAIGVWLIVA